MARSLSSSREVGMKREYHKWWSPRLGRDMELLVFGQRGTRVLVFPTRCGRFYEYENLGLVEHVRARIEAGWLQLYCVDSVDRETFYSQSAPGFERVRRHQRYEEYVLEEVLPLSEQLNRDSLVMAHGCSLGAYHALNIALRHPKRFCKAVAFSGRFDLTCGVEHFHDLFGGYRDELVYWHTPNAYLPNLHDGEHIATLRRMEVVLAVGERDPFRVENDRMVQNLQRLGIPHACHVWSGRAHSAREWSKMVELYL
jgi:esterase/lipase superfamily enzyme